MGLLTKALSEKSGRETGGLSHPGLSKGPLYRTAVHGVLHRWLSSSLPYLPQTGFAWRLGWWICPPIRLEGDCTEGRFLGSLSLKERRAGAWSCVSFFGEELCPIMFSGPIFNNVEMFDLLSHLCEANRLINTSNILESSFAIFCHENESK